MCLVVDANVFSSVFRPGSCNHAEFAPVLSWITAGPGFLVYGGTTYNNELKRARFYLGVFLELKKKGKAKEVNRGLVDKHEKIVKGLAGHTKCDDFHIIAIFRVSGCVLFVRTMRAPIVTYRTKNFMKRVNIRHLFIAMEHIGSF